MAVYRLRSFPAFYIKELSYDTVEVTNWPDAHRVYRPGLKHLVLADEHGRERHIHGADADTFLRIFNFAEWLKVSV